MKQIIWCFSFVNYNYNSDDTWERLGHTKKKKKNPKKQKTQNFLSFKKEAILITNEKGSLLSE